MSKIYCQAQFIYPITFGKVLVGILFEKEFCLRWKYITTKFTYLMCYQEINSNHSALIILSYFIYTQVLDIPDLEPKVKSAIPRILVLDENLSTRTCQLLITEMFIQSCRRIQNNSWLANNPSQGERPKAANELHRNWSHF